MTPGKTGLLLVEPVSFGYNAETAATNSLQHPTDLPPAKVAGLARAEFTELVAALRDAEVPLAIAADSHDPPKPDAVFPNNWVSFHGDGTIVLYPMRDPSRRAERREAVIDTVKAHLDFVERRRIDLTGEEKHGRFLEGTGSLVLDHRQRVAYACRSPRTDEALVREWARLMDYEPFVFDAATPDGTPVYHTNVLLWIGRFLAGVGLPWVHADQRTALSKRLGKEHELMEFTNSQLRRFAGNMLEIPGEIGRRHLIMSATAAESLHLEQLRQLADVGDDPVVAPIPLIEELGGGSVRCMLAEVPLTDKLAA